MDTKPALWASALAAVGASPATAPTLGISDAWMATPTRLEPAWLAAVPLLDPLVSWSKRLNK